MNFYPLHIGDYISHTSHLTNEEDLAYRRMIDLYYLNEHPLNGSTSIARRIRMPVEIVDSILHEFFEFGEDNCWHNKRIDEEIARYHTRLNQARKAGQASVKSRSNRSLTAVEPTKNQEPLTKNHINTIEAPQGVSLEIWNDFVLQRKKAKAVISESVIKTIAKEAAKANWSLEQALAECAARGWRGFKAEWVKDKQTQTERGNAVMLGLTRGLVGGGNNGLLSK